MTGLVGTGRLVRLALRRDRILLPAWLLTQGALAAAVVAAVTGLYANESERIAGVAFSASNVVARIFDGPASGTEIGAIAVVETYWLLAVLASLMAGQAVVRHTRLEEETGRAELIGSAVVGRDARLAAALVVAVGAALTAGALVSVVLLVNGLATTGSILAGAAVAGAGVVFSGVSAVAAQVTSTARAANATTGAVLGAAFLLRAVGDALGTVGSSGLEVISAWPSWLSPLGWGHQVRAFHQDNLDVLVLFVLTGAALIALAVWASHHRDVGAGMIGTRPGAAVAGRWLRTPLGLAWRLQRTIMLAWAVGVLVMGTAFGVVGESAEELLGLSEQLEAALMELRPEGGLIELYFSFAVGFLGPLIAGYTVQALLRMRTEEHAGRLEPLLAAAVVRTRWLGGHVVIAAVGTVALLTLLGLSGAVGYGVVTGQWAVGLQGMLVGSLLQAPAALALGAGVVLVFASVPERAAAVGWGVLVVSIVMAQLGALLELPQPLLNVSPFTHVTGVVRDVGLVPPVVLMLIAAGLTVTAAAAFRQRDVSVAV